MYDGGKLYILYNILVEKIWEVVFYKGLFIMYFENSFFMYYLFFILFSILLFYILMNWEYIFFGIKFNF